MNIKIFIFSICLLFAVTSFAQSLDGYWEGTLPIPGSDSLRIGMFIIDNNSLTIEMDSPDQYVLGIATQDVRFQDSTLSLKIPSVKASFEGQLNNKGEITGTFTQGRKLPLTLSRHATRTQFKRPQTPQGPFNYKSEEVTFKDLSGRYNLINGTLTYPNDGTPTGLYILISGSGWQDRDESLFAHKPFAVIADYLTTHNQAAVFRYDDFPVAVFAKSTSFDFADGVKLIIDSLSSRKDLAGLPITLIGHSEGSLVAFIAGASDDRINKIITLGGVATPIQSILLYQIRAIAEANGDIPADILQYSIKVSDKIYSLIAKSKTRNNASIKVGQYFDKEMAKLTPEQQKQYHMTQTDKLRTIQELCSPWFFTLFHIDPKSYLTKINCPVLAINGEKDLQVAAVENQQQMKKHLAKNQRNTFVIVPECNHLLQPCSTGSPDEYGEIETTILPEILRLIATF